MNPVTLSEYTKKYGNTFLLWCAIAFLYSEMNSYKTELKIVQEKLYNCLSVNSSVAKQSIKEIKYYAIIPNKERYVIKRSQEPLEV